MRRRIWWAGLAIATWVCVMAFPGQAFAPSNAVTTVPPSVTARADHHALTSLQAPLTDAYALYQSGRFEDARRILLEAIAQYQAAGDRLFEAAALSNLSLVYQALGEWVQAESAVRQSLEMLETTSSLPSVPIRAQALDAYGSLQLSQGNAADALDTWEDADQLYRQIEDRDGQIRASLNRATALQTLGLHRQAVNALEALEPLLEGQSESVAQVIALQSLGNSLRRVGNLQDSKRVLQESLDMAIRLEEEEAIATSHIALGNTIYALDDPMLALAQYASASQQGSSLTQVQALLNRVRVLTDTSRLPEARALVPDIEQRLSALPRNRMGAIAHITLAQQLMRLERGIQGTVLDRASQLLSTAYHQAETLGDRRVISLALGYLGELYGQVNQLEDAEPLVERALDVADGMEAADLSYRWQWQLGRIYTAQGKRKGAIAAYEQSLANLETIRGDLIATSTEVQFSFRNEIEPIYRELVSLLLDPDRTPSSLELEKARKTIESLQLAELDNFFRTACLDGNPVNIDAIDRQAAVMYPIVLADRIEVIVSIPESTASQTPSSQPKLFRHTTLLPGGHTTVEQTTQTLLSNLKTPIFSRRSLLPAQELYDWIIRPALPELEAASVTQLVFVLDDILRNIPMAVLHDGDRFLVEDYSLALTPGLQLLASEAAAERGVGVLLAGISEPRQGFSALPGVIDEIQAIRDTLAESEMLINQDVTSTTLQAVLSAVPSRVVHLATHGQFSSKLEDTFVMTWDGRIQINQLSNLLEQRELNRDRQPIELLVLSACETAEGDRRAALGLAGIAVQSGARSTIASLWQLQDSVAPLLMEEFYTALFDGGMTKAEALRHAQKTVLNRPEFSAPLFWAPVILVGNWL